MPAYDSKDEKLTRNKMCKDLKISRTQPPGVATQHHAGRL